MMDGYFAVFNGHKNNADKRARADMIKKFGKQRYAEEFKPLVKQGIMSIFDTRPTAITKYYVDRVTKYVNEKKVSLKSNKKRDGWRSESARHALARKGIKTGRKDTKLILHNKLGKIEVVYNPKTKEVKSIRGI